MINPRDSRYRDKLRILLILYFFSDETNEKEGCNRILKGEVKIQKLDFFLRYPDYLALDILNLFIENRQKMCTKDIKNDLKLIFEGKEPEIRREDMLKFFYGAYESLDNIIVFFRARNILKFESHKSINGKNIEKKYFLTNKGKDVIENRIFKELPQAKWYIKICKVIKKYYNGYTGTQLKERQYKYIEYKKATLNEAIPRVNDKFKIKYKDIFGEDIND